MAAPYQAYWINDLTLWAPVSQPIKKEGSFSLLNTLFADPVKYEVGQHLENPQDVATQEELFWLFATQMAATLYSHPQIH